MSSRGGRARGAQRQRAARACGLWSERINDLFSRATARMRIPCCGLWGRRQEREASRMGVGVGGGWRGARFCLHVHVLLYCCAV